LIPKAFRAKLFQIVIDDLGSTGPFEALILVHQSFNQSVVSSGWRKSNRQP
jgi:hypothetical protein